VRSCRGRVRGYWSGRVQGTREGVEGEKLGGTAGHIRRYPRDSPGAVRLCVIDGLTVTIYTSE
jgi:hypothetical protein